MALNEFNTFLKKVKIFTCKNFYCFQLFYDKEYNNYFKF